MSTPRSLVWLLSLLAIVLLTPAVLATDAAKPATGAVGADPSATCCPAADYDGDGVYDRVDYCNDTPRGCQVDKSGCPIDSDGDGVCDGLDRCPDTPKGEKVNADGCSASQCAVKPGALPTPTPAATVDPDAPCCPATDYDGDGVYDRIDYCNDTPKGCLVGKYGCSLDADGDGVCDGIDQCADTPKGELANPAGCSPSQCAVAAVPATPPPPPPAQEIARPATPPPPPAPKQTEAERQLVETGAIVLRDVYFDLDKATLKPESKARLDEAGAALEKFSALQVEVQGHTDSRGSARYNQKLSQARAEAVREYLLANFHLTADNLVAKGYGESQLAVSPEKSEDDYAQNRRVVLQVLNPDALPKGVKIEKQGE